ncbi:MAG: hypothetical protein AAF203_01605 [Pseudomonadota bacterium]
MKSLWAYFLILSFFSVAANARVDWNEPEVVPEKLTRKNRRVLRFSGRTSPNSKLRIKNNNIKLYLDSGKVRWAKIPAKNRNQFPLVADDRGLFIFDLYLPTIAVELPIQIKEKKKWRNYNLNFRVPKKGIANEFEAIEESFMANDDEEEKTLAEIDKEDGYYSSKEDRGRVLRDRSGRVIKSNSNLQVWGGLGISYFNTSVDSPRNTDLPSATGSAIVIPTFRLGANYDWSKKIKLMGAIRSSSGETDDIGSALATGKDFNWLEVQGNVAWFSDVLSTPKRRLGFDFGLQLQSVPFFRERPNFTNEAYFDNDVFALSLGLFYEKTTNKVWNYQIYGRYLYPISAGDSFDIESSFPLLFEFGGGVIRPLTDGLSMGVFGQMNYFSMDVSYFNTETIDTELSVLLFTADFRLIVHF